MQYTVEVGFIQFSENNNEFSSQKDQITNYLKHYITPFIDILTIQEKEKRNSKLFYDAILRSIFRERVNFARDGHEYQNIVNTIVLSDFFLQITKNDPNLARSRSNIYQLFSELIYNDPQRADQNYSFLTREAVKYLDLSLDEFSLNQFAKKRKIQLNDSLTIQEQLHLFDHDISSKISTLNSLIRKLKGKAEHLKEPESMERIINDITAVLNLSKDEIPDAEDVDILLILKEIQHESKLKIELQPCGINGDNNIWKFVNKGYLMVIFENLIKNSKEAYKRNSITVPDPSILIKADFIHDIITIQDWAGGVPSELLHNDKLFEPYVSEKGCAQSTGLGLSLVKKACKMLSLDIKYKVSGNSTTVLIQKFKE
ncbi:MAG: ATP-binding protein [Candidatus Cloacimonadota bacterium]|nr:ATP-binding protein [Candidatus Cloacimonadota bacterium]